MADAEAVIPQTDTEAIEDASRRGFIRAAVTAGVAGAAGLVVGAEALAAEVKKQTLNASALKISAAPSTPEEHAKDQKRAQALKLFQDLNQNVEIHWVKGSVPSARRIIQMYG